MAESFDQAMAVFSPALPLAVGYSGGADSTALLQACAEKWPGRVVAIHVHHGLQAAADGFELHCRGFCDRLGVPLQVLRVGVRGFMLQIWGLFARICKGRAGNYFFLVRDTINRSIFVERIVYEKVVGLLSRSRG